MENESRPTFSILTATFNRRAKLQRALKSLQALKSRDWEWIVIDDGSTDGTAEDFQETSENIHYHLLSSNVGANRARNHGLSFCSGQWIVLLDSDNQLLPDALSIIHHQVAQYSVDCIFFFQCRSLSDGSLLAKEYPHPLVSFPDYMNRSFSGEYHPVIRTEVLRKYPFWDEVQGGERIQWSIVIRDCGRAIVSNSETIIYDDTGTDRLSNRWQNVRRLRDVFLVDLRVLWREYLRYSPRALYQIGVRIIFYTAVVWFQKMHSFLRPRTTLTSVGE